MAPLPLHWQADAPVIRPIARRAPPRTSFHFTERNTFTSYKFVIYENIIHLPNLFNDIM